MIQSLSLIGIVIEQSNNCTVLASITGSMFKEKFVVTTILKRKDLWTLYILEGIIMKAVT